MLERCHRSLERTPVVQPEREPDSRTCADGRLDDAVAGLTRSSAPHGDRLRPDRRAIADRLPEEARDVAVRRMRPHVVGRADLHDATIAQHCHAVAERERLRLVVRDVERGHGELGEERVEVVEETVPQPPVERAQRLVEKQDARLRRERAGEGDALLLAARERRRPSAARSPRGPRARGDRARGPRSAAAGRGACAARRRRCPTRRGGRTARGPGRPSRSRVDAPEPGRDRVRRGARGRDRADASRRRRAGACSCRTRSARGCRSPRLRPGRATRSSSASRSPNRTVTSSTCSIRTSRDGGARGARRRAPRSPRPP